MDCLAAPASQVAFTVVIVERSLLESSSFFHGQPSVDILSLFIASHLLVYPRTGRVRPGTVYKLYSKTLGESYMEEHEAAEIRRLPLDSVILDLKNMLNSSPVVPVLEVSRGSLFRGFEANQGGSSYHLSSLG